MPKHEDKLEFTSLPPEQAASPMAEFSPPPDEFKPSPQADEQPRIRRSRFWQLAVSAVVASAVILPNAVRAPAEIPPTVQTAPTEIPTQPPETTVPETTPPETIPETVPETIPETVPETYPIRDGKCLITVYNDDVDMENSFRNRILFQELISESDLTQLTLPEPVAVEGYHFAGYAIFYGPYAADWQDIGYTAGTKEFAAAVSSPLTAENLVRVPVWEDGIRYVNIHVCWLPETDDTPLLFLDDGTGSTIGFGIGHPLESGGFLYLDAYPQPEREGLRFAGWYDAAGNRVTYLLIEDLYPVIGIADDGYEQRDWHNPQSVTLTAGWAAK